MIEYNIYRCIINDEFVIPTKVSGYVMEEFFMFNGSRVVLTSRRAFQPIYEGDLSSKIGLELVQRLFMKVLFKDFRIVV